MDYTFNTGLNANSIWAMYFWRSAHKENKQGELFLVGHPFVGDF